MIWVIINLMNLPNGAAQVSALSLLVVATLPSSMNKFVILPKLGLSLLLLYDLNFFQKVATFVSASMPFTISFHLSCFYSFIFSLTILFGLLYKGFRIGIGSSLSMRLTFLFTLINLAIPWVNFHQFLFTVGLLGQISSNVLPMLSVKLQIALSIFSQLELSISSV